MDEMSRIAEQLARVEDYNADTIGAPEPDEPLPPSVEVELEDAFRVVITCTHSGEAATYNYVSPAYPSMQCKTCGKWFWLSVGVTVRGEDGEYDEILIGDEPR